MCGTDVIFALDKSSTAGPFFHSLKSFVSQLAAALDIDSGDTRLGLVVYDHQIGEHFDLNTHSSLASVQTAINSLGGDGVGELLDLNTHASLSLFLAAMESLGGGTRTDLALKYVRESMLTPAAGDRPPVPNVVVLFTDGRADYKSTMSLIEVSSLHTCAIL